MLWNVLFLFGTLFLFIILRVPIVFALGISAFIYLAFFGEGIPLAIISQRLIGGVDSFPLLAVPFFYLAGELMNSGGITKRLIDFSSALVGPIRGGLSYVVVITNMIMAGISGSCMADASATGTVLIPSMKKDGYGADYAAALVAAASTIGPIIPPSVLMIIYGVTANVSIGKLFLGGIVPGVLMGIYLMVFSYFVAKRRNYPVSPKTSIKVFIKSLYGASFALAIPIFVIGGIVGGIVTATEGGVIAVLASLVVALFIYRDLDFKKLPNILGSVGIDCGLVLLIIAGGSAFGWVLANLGVGDSLVNLFLSISTNKWVILILINIFLLILGCFIDPMTGLIIFGPVFVPLAQKVGVDLVQFGVIMVLNLILGNLTPPMGMLLFITSAIGKVPFEKVVKEVLPFLIALIFVLSLITYFPLSVLWIPDLLMGK